MNRRNFIQKAGAGTLGAAAGLSYSGTNQITSGQAQSSRKKALMHVGTQRVPNPITARVLQFYKRHGVDNICGFPPPNAKGRWEVSELLKMKDLCESQGIKLDIVTWPLLPLPHNTHFRNILLGKDPERNEEIDRLCEMIRVTAEAEIPCIKYNFFILAILRTERTPGRGGSSYSTWAYDEAPKDIPLSVAGEVDEDEYWERITYLLERVVPVAEEYKIRLACHPHDPGFPPRGYNGVQRVLGTVEGMKRFIEIEQNPYHGLNLCLGSTAEMLQDPRKEIFDVIRYFGTRKKIFNIHFRNIRGKRNKFQEVYPDNGDMDMLQAMKTLRDVEYPYMVMPDHMPGHPGDQGGDQAFAFGYGYIKALIQAVNNEV